MAHPLVTLRLLLTTALIASAAGCYASHGRLEREPPPTTRPVVDASVSRPDSPAAPDAAVCLDCSCCSCGRPSTGAICPLIGLGECCIAPTGFEVDAAISSATLGDECAMAERDGDCAIGGCGCVQTAVQLALGATGTPGRRANIAVVSVRLLRDGALASELLPQALLVWSAEAAGYVPWDAAIASGEDLRVRVETSAPDWTAIGGGDAWRSFGISFRVEVTLSVDGVERELYFEPAIREPEIDT